MVKPLDVPDVFSFVVELPGVDCVDTRLVVGAVAVLDDVLVSNTYTLAPIMAAIASDPTMTGVERFDVCIAILYHAEPGHLLGLAEVTIPVEKDVVVDFCH